MKLFLGTYTAQEYWRQAARPSKDDNLRVRPRHGARYSLDDLAALPLRQLGLSSDVVHIVVADKASRCQADGIKSSIWNPPEETAAFVRITDELYVSSPEATFLQMATELSLVELIMYGYEICGLYALDPAATAGFVLRGEHLGSAEPLTTVAKLARFTAKMDGRYGAKKARIALEHILDRSRSPMETCVAMLLCLPPRLGGYGLEHPALNCPIETTKVNSDNDDAVPYLRFCDLYWPRVRVGLEYDSDQHHVGRLAGAGDSIRRTELGRKGVTIRTLKKEEVRDVDLFHSTALLLKKDLGRTRLTSRKDFPSKRAELRRVLLPWWN